MEHKMRRFKQELSEAESIELLKNATSGVLSLCGNDGKPYGVPLSFVYSEGKLIFHSAMAGHKVDIIKENSNACFTIISMDEIHPERFTTYYKSVIVQGKLHLIEEEDEKVKVTEILGRKYNPDDKQALDKEIQSAISHILVYEMEVEKISGKQAIELVYKDVTWTKKV